MRRPLARLFLAALPLCAASGLAAAQTTHQVTLAGTSFTPANLSIAVGDTVEWVWQSGQHNVSSGTGGVHDGIFRSGDPVFPPMTFSVTFDQAFLDANPVPGKVYDYFCIVHVGFGMTGTVTVEVPSSAALRNAGTNPASLSLGGSPTIGSTFGVTVDLTTTGHDDALLFGFDTPITVTLSGGQTLLCFDGGGSGELLGQSAQSGPSALFTLPVPNNPSLCGFSFSAQAIHFGGVTPFALSEAVDVTIGNV